MPEFGTLAELTAAAELSKQELASLINVSGWDAGELQRTDKLSAQEELRCVLAVIRHGGEFKSGVSASFAVSLNIGVRWGGGHVSCGPIALDSLNAIACWMLGSCRGLISTGGAALCAGSHTAWR